MNLFAYCGNDPVNRVDPNGDLAIAAIGIIAKEIALPLLGLATAALIGAIATADTASDAINNADIAIEPWRPGSLIKDYKIKHFSDSISDSIPKVKDVTDNKPLSGTIIYRHRGTNAGNLVPSVRDVSTDTGLSFSTIYQQNSFCTTIEQINSTGVLTAVKDGITHVTIKPVGGNLSQWRSEGTSSVWTQTLLAICIKIK